MYDTPSARTSKHVSKRAQIKNRKRNGNGNGNAAQLLAGAASATSASEMEDSVTSLSGRPMDAPAPQAEEPEPRWAESMSWGREIEVRDAQEEVEEVGAVTREEDAAEDVADVRWVGWGASPLGLANLDFDRTDAAHSDDAFDSDAGPPLLDDAPALFDEGPVAPEPPRAPESAYPLVADDSHDENAEQAADAGFGALSNILETVQSVPLPVQHPALDAAGDDSPPSSPVVPRSSGRTRAPSLVTRNVTSPSSLSRQLQNVQTLLPTSPQLPSLGFSNPLANFAAPRITNVTVSGSSFNNQPSRPTTDHPFMSPREARRRSTGTFTESRDRTRARLNMTPSRGNESDEEDPVRAQAAGRQTRYPTTSAISSDKVVFASFATLPGSSPTKPPRRLLFIGYENGLQIWETTHLGEVRELLNRRISGAVVGCRLLPAPIPPAGRGLVTDAYEHRRPLVGIIVEEHDACYLLVYSLATHEVVQKLDFSGASVTSVQASGSFIIISTSSPTSLHILCSRTLNILHTLQARQLSIFSRPVTLHTLEGAEEVIYSARQDRPHAVFALSNRLLAFASVPPAPETSSLTSIYPRMAIPHSPSIQLGSLSVSQADIGNAALKVGGGLLSGMKVLSGIAVAAARGEMSTPTSTENKGFRKFFSRSAPSATSSIRHERRPSSGGSSTVAPGDGHDSEPGTARPGDDAPSSTGHITVLDLQPLLDDREAGRPERLSDFSIPSGQVVADLKFSEDGTNVVVIPSDGNVVRTYQIKPPSRILRQAALNTIANMHGTREKAAFPSVRTETGGNADDQYGLQLSSNEPETLSAPWHIYDLRRGRTSAVVEAVEFSNDCRWIGIVSRKRTIHVLATNPYGGKPDEASHLEGKVKNVDGVQPLSTELRPLTRLRSRAVSSAEKLSVPLVVSYVSSSTEVLPPKFQPTHTFSPPASIASSLPSSAPGRRAQSISPRQAPRPTNYQDILVFDPSDGSLSLRRLTLSTRVVETGTTFLSSLPIPSGTSISLPGMSFMGRSSSSPPKPSSTSPPPEQLPTELVARDTVVATWNLMRDSKWTDVKEPVLHEQPSGDRRAVTKSEWLAQAELSTFTQSTRILPGPIYLSHQFTFFGFSEDYHALLRRLHFDIAVQKIEVRRQVEAIANVSRHGESFISATSNTQDIRGGRSFDEPLATAIYTGLDYSGTSPPVIPMLPNGARTGSFKSALPIRSVAAGLSEGVNEGIGRLSRGIRRVRSPRLGPRADETFVPLEFDEEDEDFLNRGSSQERRRRESNDNDNDHDDTLSNSGGGRDSQSLSTPSTNNNVPLPETGSDHDGWLDNMDAVEEVERFDEINAAGYADAAEKFRISGLGAKGYPGRKGR